jgi:hypothetical protein
MIAGVVTTKDVLLHSAAIVHDFGLRTWLSCCKAILTNRRTTFLELVWQQSNQPDLAEGYANAAA